LFFDSFGHDVDSFDVLIKLLAKIAITNSITPTLNWCASLDLHLPNATEN
jgi:hypothetical protein